MHDKAGQLGRIYRLSWLDWQVHIGKKQMLLSSLRASLEWRLKNCQAMKKGQHNNSIWWQ
jgi:hypothetical protein